MRSKRLVAIIITAILALVSCTRDPNVAKRRYLESGNKYFDKGKYKEARIMYLNAKAKDQRWGPAYYKLGLTALKMGSIGGERVSPRHRVAACGRGRSLGRRRQTGGDL